MNSIPNITNIENLHFSTFKIFIFEIFRMNPATRCGQELIKCLINRFDRVSSSNSMISDYINGIIKILKDHIRDGALLQVTDMVPVIDMDWDNIWIYVSLIVFIWYKIEIQKRLMLKRKLIMANAFLIRPKSLLPRFYDSWQVEKSQKTEYRTQPMLVGGNTGLNQPKMTQKWSSKCPRSKFCIISICSLDRIRSALINFSRLII